MGEASRPELKPIVPPDPRDLRNPRFRTIDRRAQDAIENLGPNYDKAKQAIAERTDERLKRWPFNGKISRRNFLKTAGLALGSITGATGTAGILSFLKGRNPHNENAINPASADSKPIDLVSPKIERGIARIDTMNEVISTRIEELDITQIEDQINFYNSKNTEHQVLTISLTEDGELRESTPKIQLFKITEENLPLNVRSTPEVESENIIGKKIETIDELNGITNQGYFLGIEMRGGRYNGPNGNQIMYNGRGESVYGGIWVAPVEVNINDEGRKIISFANSMMPQGPHTKPAIPSIARLNIRPTQLPSH